ncbi:MAG: glycosyltransferase family 4 protein [Candidatus Omnitrophica bacterium]|nr:glycosyltransferase family 4 protein [Candidatus Omnitrophota bacterium]MBU1925093.1 glycosyltransferase family 4 protein [Candidatus Omnitrophota bacterium]
MKTQPTHKCKVLHIITRLIIGGAQENTLITLRGLNSTGSYETGLLCGQTLGPEGSLEDEARNITDFKVLPQLVRNINPVIDLIALVRIYLFIKKGGYHIVHTHSSKAGILGRCAAKLAGVPLIIHTIHGLPFFKHQNPVLNNLYIMLERFAAAFTDKIICVSGTLIDNAVSAKIAPTAKFIRIFSGINLEKYTADGHEKDAFKKKLGIGENQPVVGTIARLFYQKGHRYLIDAAVRVAKKIPGVKFLFVGDGILKEKLQKEVFRLNLGKNVIFAGLITPDLVPRYLEVMDVLAHASLHEGLPRAVVQAQLLGVPSVCFDIDGARDIVKHGSSGYLVKPQDSADLADRIIELLTDKNKSREFGRNGQRLARENFGAKKMVDDINALYQNLISRCGI